MEKVVKNLFAKACLLVGFITLVGNLCGCTYAIRRMSLLPDENYFVSREVWNKNPIKMTSKLGTPYGINIQPLTKLKILEIRKESCAGTDYNWNTYAGIMYIAKFQDEKGNISMLHCASTPSSYYDISTGIPQATSNLKSFLNDNFLFENPYEKHPDWPEQRWKAIKEGRINFEAYYASNPEWNKEVWDKIDKGELWIGASKEMVTCVLGKPLSTSKEVDSSGSHEKNIYTKDGRQIELYFDDGKLIKFKE